ncbi:hypothetical protein TthAA37_10340 [Thermus thermophilus]|uniref:Uncharacterized protein n=1 Tax=Thermus thermophilus TaxID=274 RepID=A0AAD1KUU3_THETH|nr:hypothetical protein TthAA11_10180 [Thermus thermophilus]BCZ89209.1 hypothetical protein TthAA22_10140 [Thermus thermophilus]BCZ91845.1 hypothetical protein TthAA37_10340 [Thermus thermophilus]BCZ94386.1 hypothetical protein TthAK1_10030 [Thermus thermophilus]
MKAMQDGMLQLPMVNLQEPAQAPTRGGMNYKPSRFNHFHTLPTGEKLAFNSLSSGLAVLDSEGWAPYTALANLYFSSRTCGRGRAGTSPLHGLGKGGEEDAVDSQAG